MGGCCKAVPGGRALTVDRNGAAVLVSRWIQSGYHGILGIDGEAFGSAVGLFIVAMVLASAIPAARASRLDPVENLRDA